MARKTRRGPPGRSARVRIIGGAWRRQWLPVPSVGGLRPTADAQRETLFNWLQPQLPGARVLDLYAGTGALGFEAASRGAREVWLVERDARAAAQLEANRERLGATQVHIRRDDVARLLGQPPEAGPFDVVFLDPPFGQGRVAPTLAALAAQGWLSPGARVYAELESEADPGCVQEGGWDIERERVCGQARGLLLARSRAEDES
ncbi:MULTISPECIES: 16S rRNA (guanine(966)-N(2))-methyltransferase RsmD [unclassified Thioalkalivibrio]|uniref:16S rRNA (guanine(966)-N(2))-methyltransferase RsmD n=1 Tax=unclassified Thioalkalivibrio TaxID=2621013 RepID=UPI002101140D|nr:MULTISPECIES: 16S rRNA (guanine(966)-N(2))-methyltransferase RsmD [unclassified Thioalkalivibrio]